MYQITREKLTTDHIIARSIYGNNGELLLGRGAQLTTEVLKLLPDIGQELFWVQDEISAEIQFDPVIREQLAMQTTHEMITNGQKFRSAFDLNCQSLEDVKRHFKDIHKFSSALNADRIKDSAVNLVQGVLSSPAVLLNLHGMRSRTSWLYQNAMESTVTALMIAKKFQFEKHEMEELAIGCLLMDTGYLVLPEELINRPDRISWEEYQLMRKHPELGFQILRANPGIPLISAHISWQHHECQDGTGFPRQLHGSHRPPYIKSKEAGEIHRFSEIAQIAESYVRLLHPRNQRIQRTPMEVIRILLKASLSRLNRSIVDALVTMIPIFPPGTRIVILQDPKQKWVGWKGIVTKVPQDNPERPEIQLFEDNHGELCEAIKISTSEYPDIRLQYANIPKN